MWQVFFDIARMDDLGIYFYEYTADGKRRRYGKRAKQNDLNEQKQKREKTLKQ